MSGLIKHIFTRFEGRYIKIVFEEVLFLEAVQNFVRVHCVDKEILLLISLRQLEREMPDTFCRVHRSYVVNTANIQSFDHSEVDFGKKSTPISRQYKDVLPKKLKVVVSDTRHRSPIYKIEIKDFLN